MDDASPKIEGGRDECKIIAEIGINHNGSIELCKKLIMAAKVAGA
jgi:sialic acid synthase SpsE